MRLCEYVKVPQQEKRQTEILLLQNLRFFDNSRLVYHNDPNLKYFNSLNITFEMQKKDKKNNTTTQMTSGNISLCPVCAAAAIVQRIQLYPGVNNNTPISAIWIYERINHITSHQSKSQMHCKMPSWQLGRTPSILPRTKLEHTQSDWVQQWPCNSEVALSS